MEKQRSVKSEKLLTVRFRSCYSVGKLSIVETNTKEKDG